MEDSLTIVDLELWTRVGITAEERRCEQRLLVSVSWTTDTRRTAATDSLSRDQDYAILAEVIRTAGKRKCATIETLTETIAEAALAHTHSASVTVSLKKFALPRAREVLLTITRASR